MAEQDEGTELRGDWKRRGIVISVAYALALLVFVTVGKGPAGALHEFVGLPLNSLGDFLAGVFAPLAFLWLFVATMLQSQELAAQRRELELTREEVKLTREGNDATRQVQEAQAEEAKRSAEAFMAQTRLLEEKERREVTEFATARLSADIDMFMEWALNTQPQYITIRSENEREADVGGLRPGKGMPSTLTLLKLSAELRDTARLAASRRERDATTYIAGVTRESLEGVRKRMSRVLADRPGLGDAERSFIEDMNPREYFEALDLIARLVRE